MQLAPLAEAFNAGAESLTSILNEQLAKAQAELLDKDAQIERLEQELALADICIDRYSRGLM